MYINTNHILLCRSAQAFSSCLLLGGDVSGVTLDLHTAKIYEGFTWSICGGWEVPGEFSGHHFDAPECSQIHG